jgi:hypothetical protein
MLKTSSFVKRLGSRRRRLLCGGFASTDRRMTETRNNGKKKTENEKERSIKTYTMLS